MSKDVIDLAVNHQHHENNIDKKQNRQLKINYKEEKKSTENYSEQDFQSYQGENQHVPKKKQYQISLQLNKQKNKEPFVPKQIQNKKKWEIQKNETKPNISKNKVVVNNQIKSNEKSIKVATSLLQIDQSQKNKNQILSQRDDKNLSSQIANNQFMQPQLGKIKPMQKEKIIVMPINNNQIILDNNNNNNPPLNSSGEKQQKTQKIQNQDMIKKLDSQLQQKSKLNYFTLQQSTSPKEQKKQNKHKKDKQTAVMQKIKNEKENIEKKLKAMINQHRQLEYHSIDFNKRNENKQKQIKQFLNKLQKEKIQRSQKIQKSKLIQPKETSDIDEQQKILEKKRKIKQHYEMKISQLQRNRIKREKQNSQFKQFYKHFKNSKPIYIRNELQQKAQKQNDQLEYQKKLKAISKRYASVNQQQLQQHAKNYEQAMIELQNAKKYQRKLFLKSIEEQNQKLQKLWKGKSHQIIQEQIENNLRKKQMPKQKLNRARDYYKSVKEKIILTSRNTRKSQDQITQNKKSNTHRQVRRYKYINGISYGQVTQQMPIEKTLQQKKLIGNSYLEMVKSLPKKKQQKNNDDLFKPSQFIIKPKPQIPKIVKQLNPLYDKKNFQIKLSNNPTRQQIQSVLYKFATLDNHVKNEQQILRYQQIPDIYTYQAKQKKINDDLLRSIESKLDVLASL